MSSQLTPRGDEGMNTVKLLRLWCQISLSWTTDISFRLGINGLDFMPSDKLFKSLTLRENSFVFESFYLECSEQINCYVGEFR